MCLDDELPGEGNVAFDKNAKGHDYCWQTYGNARDEGLKIAMRGESKKERNYGIRCKERLIKSGEALKMTRKSFGKQLEEKRSRRKIVKIVKSKMFYESEERRRLRLDNEAAKKRDYRMYDETTEQRRKRLDREAERRRLNRLKIYANETEEERRERLNRESTKRRESRLNQYAKESEEERQERLKKDATRVREMRFTRSAIESEDERRERLIKDAKRKRELRIHGDDEKTEKFHRLESTKNFNESKASTQLREQSDFHFGGHFIGNLMMWLQNSAPQNGDEINVCDTV